MNKESKDFLVTLLNDCGPSGFEEKVQNIWYDRTKKYADKMYRDVMGNSVAILNPKADFKIMLAGHCDEIGFIITHISNDGFLYVEAIGGMDKTVLPGSHVKVLGENKVVNGIIGKKAIHLENANERGKVREIKNIFIDIGAKNKKDAEKLVSVGDPITFAPNYLELKNGLFSSKGCDDKVGAFVVSEVVKILSSKKSKLKVGVYSTATVQEEVGLRGAWTSAFGINPNVGIAVDVSFTSDVPDLSETQLGNVSIGKGGILSIGPANNRKLSKIIRNVAKKKKIPYQVQSSGSPYGTDTHAIQLTRSGVATALISIPLRYMHTQVETCCFKDLENTAKLIAEIILAIKSNMNFIPK